MRVTGHSGFKLASAEKVSISEQDIKKLMAFKETEQKNDPARVQGIHGPYEEMVLTKTGKLPEDYYEDGDGDDEPWGLRIPESRSNILWQVTSGMMDRYPEFGGAYMALALDHGLGDKEYVTELTGLHRDWRNYVEHAGLLNDHQHQTMGHIYRSVACPACSVLTAMASRDEKMITLFKSMTGLKPAERREFLRDRGLLPYMDMMIPDSKGPVFTSSPKPII